MGIQGLLPLLKSIHKPTHLRNFSGQTLGVDAYGWLHRGTISCAIELAEGKPTRKHIDFALHRVRMLIHFGVKPYLVFDGDYLPSKAHTEKERAARRKESKRVGLELLRMGRPSQAHQELQKAVDVTPAMARELIEELKHLDVPYVVAPYEADSQLAYLEKQGVIQGVVSEDSDLLVFGVNCLLTKLDQYGECVMINRADFTACKDISLVGWTDKDFRIMAMLSGCDYLPGIDKMGLKTAYRLVRKHKTVERVVRTVQFDGKMKVPAGYLEAFQNAERTFLHQWVFCSESQSLLHLTPLPTGTTASSLPYIGKHVEPEVAAGVASGDLDPNTKRPIPMPNRFQNRATRHQVVHTPSEKAGKPITEFFKKRTPLAELDPNSFTPSPSQQRLLQTQETLSWSASQVPTSRVFGQTRAANSSAPSTAPAAFRRTATNPLPFTRRASPKRQRLCSENSALATAMNGTEDVRGPATSRFFAPTPSARKKSNRNEHDEFELWSDDSTAEAVVAAAAAPDATPSLGASLARKRKKLNVFVDTTVAEMDDSVGDISQESIPTTATTASREPAIIDTPDMSLASVESSEVEGASSERIRAKISAFRHGSGTPVRTSPPRTKSAPVLATTPLQNVKPLEGTADEQDIGRSGADVVPCSSPLLAQISSEGVGEGADEELDDIIDDAEWQEIGRKTVRRRESIIIQGSEDFLVPESPENTVEDEGSVTKLSLRKFAYAV
ncbi:Exodeoxyribonuclease 1 [Lecanosticta acicola]|uniref:Exodeoxyribonuclease 1 n=1 Tax=Lecanosticta acicola TaxID=111012 RepID=A0AAI8Z1I6_9PEZI|nr:Exodeoxyribonuclease 1 [Lecanosticta acicola]